MEVLSNKPEQLVVAFNKVRLCIYEHPDGDLIIYATQPTRNPDEDKLINIILHDYEGVMGARVPARAVRGEI